MDLKTSKPILTDDGELIEGSREPKRLLKPDGALIVFGIVAFVVFTVMLGRYGTAQGINRLLMVIPTVLLALATVAIQLIPSWRSLTDHLVEVVEGQRSSTKHSDKIGKWAADLSASAAQPDSSDPTIAPIDNLFLVDSDHQALISGYSSKVKKYGFDLEFRSVYLFAIPFYLVSTLAGALFVWTSLILLLFKPAVPSTPDGSLLCAGLGWGMVGSVMIFWGTRRIRLTIRADRNYRRLVGHGQILYGQIAHWECESYRNELYAIYYRFYTPEENSISAVQRIPHFGKYPLPNPGMSVAVLYADDTCYKLL